jgi:hypothetical protein
VPKSVSEEARLLVTRGLERFERGEVADAVSDWEMAERIDKGNLQARRLARFGQAKIVEVERGLRASPSRHDTLESPIPQFLAALTGRRSAEVKVPILDGPTPRVDLSAAATRDVMENSGEISAEGIVRDVSPDTLEDLQIHVGDIRASTNELIGECRASLNAGRGDSAALAAELALQLAERAPPPGVDELIEASRALFERAFRACLGNLQACPIRSIAPEHLTDHGFDHRAAFLMSRMDCVASLADIIDSSGMPSFEATRLLAGLRRARVIDLLPV